MYKIACGVLGSCLSCTLYAQIPTDHNHNTAEMIQEDTQNQTTQNLDTHNPITLRKATHKNMQVSPVVVSSSWTKDALFSGSHINFYGKDTPLHSGDIAKSFLHIPGFSMARKGGGGSEILFRSQSASRLPIFLGGGVLNGACGGRMDTTTTYTFPENYDKIQIYKGPQDVRYGALIAGGVLFERDIVRLEKPSFKGNASFLYGSFRRLDVNASALAGGKYGSLQAIVSHYSADDYKAGGNKAVHSAYNRESVSLIGTLTPTDSSALEFDVDMGRGFASYADRAMDARTFDRISYNLKYQQHFNETFDMLDIRAWYNDIDHIMDNFSHRPVINNEYRLSNPKRTNIGTRIEGKLHFDNMELYIGGNYNYDSHSSRTGNGQSADSANTALTQSYTPNFLFQNAGFFSQGAYMPDEEFGIFFGARYDYVGTLQHSTNATLHDNLGSAFARYEHYMDNAIFYAGLGVAQRAADFWERGKNGGMTLKPETNTQIDMGLTYEDSFFNIRTSLFASYIADYILLHYGTATSAMNTNAMLLGGEIAGEYVLLDSIHFYTSLAYTYGQNLNALQSAGYNLAAHTPLPQIAPLQGQASVFYEKSGWLLRFDVFFNAAQMRYAKDFGNVIGKDLGASNGFAVLNLYVGYRLKQVMLFAGIDNLTDTLYAYHLSKSGVEIGALNIAPSARVYEPGRSIWAKISMRF